MALRDWALICEQQISVPLTVTNKDHLTVLVKDRLLKMTFFSYTLIGDIIRNVFLIDTFVVIQTTPPGDFDTRLPDITSEDINTLREKLPELSHVLVYVSPQFFRALPNFAYLFHYYHHGTPIFFVCNFVNVQPKPE